MTYVRTIKFHIPDYKDIYPESVFFYKYLEYISLKNITILYGNNGSGKSTILNIIGELMSKEKNHCLRIKCMINMDILISHLMTLQKIVRSLCAMMIMDTKCRCH